MIPSSWRDVIKVDLSLISFGGHCFLTQMLPRTKNKWSTVSSVHLSFKIKLLARPPCS